MMSYGEPALWIQSFPTPSEFQTFFSYSSRKEMEKIVNYVFPYDLSGFLCSNLQNRLVTPQILRTLVVKAFRSDSFAKPIDSSMKKATDETDEIDTAFEAIKLLNDQLLLAVNTSVKETFKIRVAVTAVYDSQRASVLPGYHSFFYRVIIENNSEDVVQVLGRRWVFHSPGSESIIVPRFATGVIGQQPILNPGESFQYMSMTNLGGREGQMEGSFLMESSDHRQFEVEIAECALKPHVFAK